MVEWLAGNRIRGTSTERASGDFNNHLTGVGAVGGWKEVGRTTLEGVGDFINVSSLPDKRYYMILHDVKPSGNVWTENTFNNDLTGGNTANRRHVDGSADGNPQTSANYIYTSATQSTPMFGVYYIANKSDKEKLQIYHNVMGNTAGVGTVPRRYESFSKWANTSDPISTFNLHNGSTGDFDTGSEVVVLGWDPDDTHTDNFWEQLASVELESAATEVNSGVFTSKKYLWIQAYIKSDGSTMRPQIRVGNTTMDSDDNYAWVGGENGTEYPNDTANEMCDIKQGGANTDPVFFNGFIVNNSANEKLMIGHSVIRNTAGAGYAPKRIEIASKWVNISNQINVINVDDFNSGTNFGIGSIIKVWGSN